LYRRVGLLRAIERVHRFPGEDLNLESNILFLRPTLRARIGGGKEFRGQITFAY
jgi:hypothetical protein